MVKYALRREFYMTCRFIDILPDAAGRLGWFKCPKTARYLYRAVNGTPGAVCREHLQMVLRW